MRKKFPSLTLIIQLTLILVSACSQSKIATTDIVTSTPSATPLPSSTPTATYIPITPVFSGTQAPISNSVISAENVDRLTLFARWGNGNATDAQYTPDGKYLVATYSTGIYFYDAKNFSLAKYIDLGTALTDLTITKDGHKIAVASLDSVFIFNQGEDQPTVTIDETALSLAFSPNGEILALGAYHWPAGSGIRPEGIKLFNPVTGKMISEFKDSDLALTLAFSPDGTRLTAGGYATQVWDLNGELLDIHGPFVSGGATLSLSFSPDGSLLAEGADTTNILHVWRVLPNGKLTIFQTISLGNYPIVPQVFGVAISPDGKQLAAATTNGLKVWELSSGTLIYDTNDSSESSTRYYNIAWSPDGDSLVAISEKKGIDVYNIKNRELSRTINTLACNAPRNLDSSAKQDKLLCKSRSAKWQGQEGHSTPSSRRKWSWKSSAAARTWPRHAENTV